MADRCAAAPPQLLGRTRYACCGRLVGFVDRTEEKALSLDKIWWGAAWPWGAGADAYNAGPGDTATGSWGWEVWTNQPTTVYAFAAMQMFHLQGYGAGFQWGTDTVAFGGVISYTTSDAAEPVHVGRGQPHGVVPAIFAARVTDIVFAYGVSVPYEESVDASFSFQIFGWDLPAGVELVGPAKEKVGVIYHPLNGGIVHTHRIVTPTSLQVLPDGELEARMRTVATQLGHDVTGLATLTIAAEAYDPSARYKVDVTTHQLVQLDRPTPVRRGRRPTGLARLFRRSPRP
jgi:hypothetical protein